MRPTVPSSLALILLTALPAAAQRVDDGGGDAEEAGFQEVAREGSDDIQRARTLFEEAERAYAQGDLRGAVRNMEQAHRLTQAHELAYNVARIYERMSEFDDAIRWYRRYLRDARPEETVQAEVSARIEALREAKSRVRSQVFTMPPTDDELTQEAGVFFRRGVAMFRRRRYEAALQAFIAARRFAPLPEIFFNMAVTAERLEHDQDAIDYYREYLRTRPSAADRGLVERRIARLRGE